jgi:hypothetical protein
MANKQGVEHLDLVYPEEIPDNAEKIQWIAY